MKCKISETGKKNYNRRGVSLFVSLSEHRIEERARGLGFFFFVGKSRGRGEKEGEEEKEGGGKYSVALLSIAPSLRSPHLSSLAPSLNDVRPGGGSCPHPGGSVGRHIQELTF